MISRLSYLTALIVAVSAWLVVFCGPAAAQAGLDKALGQPATASSVERPERRGNCANSRNGCAPRNATDGDPRTRWGADWVEGQWWQVDLGRARAVDSMRLSWEYSFPKRYLISTSLDGVSFADARVVQPAFATLPLDLRTEYVETSAFPARLARFVRVTSIERFWPRWGISLWDARVTGPADSALAPSTPAPTPSAPPPSAPVPPPATSTPPSGSSTPTASTPSPDGAGGGKPTDFQSKGTSSTGPTAPSTSTPSAPASGPSRSPARSRLELLRPFPIVRIRGSATRRGASIDFVSVRAPRSARVRVVCRGASCRPRRVMRQQGSGRVRSLRGFLRAGTIIEVFVTRSGRLGKYTRFVVRDRTVPPLRKDGCATHGASRPTACS